MPRCPATLTAPKKAFSRSYLSAHSSSFVQVPFEGSNAEGESVAEVPLPSQLVNAISAFWKGHPTAKEIEYPYDIFWGFLHRQTSGDEYRKWGYANNLDLLMDAQAAGLLWLSSMSATGQPDHARFVIKPAAKKDYRNPAHALYWQAIGISPQAARCFAQLTCAKRWDHEVVGVLASTSPHYDSHLHRIWYYQKAGIRSWAVREGCAPEVSSAVQHQIDSMGGSVLSAKEQ